MASLDEEAAKLLEFLKRQPLVPENAEHEGEKGVVSAAKRLYNGETVKDAGNEKASVKASAEVDSLLSRISADCSYADWFRVACALKHEGCAYEVVRDWSATAPNRFE